MIFFVFLVCHFWDIPSQNHNRNIQCVNIFMKTAYNLDNFLSFSSNIQHHFTQHVFVMIYLVRNSTAVSLMFRLDSLVFKESFITSSEKIFVIYCLCQSIMLKQIIIIIITRPKLPYGRQGLAGSWSKDRVRRVHFGVLSRSSKMLLIAWKKISILMQCLKADDGTQFSHIYVLKE